VLFPGFDRYCYFRASIGVTSWFRSILLFPCFSSHIHSLIDNFETHYLKQQATELQSKLWILSLFGEQHSQGHWGTNLKNDLCQQAFISRGKHSEPWVRALNGSGKDLEIQTLEVLMQNPTNSMAEKGCSALVIDLCLDRKELFS